MPYVPLARKYRPQTFADLIGQAHVTTTLVRAIETKRVGQAYLFAGQRGVGKTSAARILAKSLNCAQGPTTKPCLSCPSCLAITQGNSLDVIEVDGASNRGIDHIRDLRETVRFAPAQGAYRIYIIDEVHQITPDGFNALLKTLEEPPAHVKFIFATTMPDKVPATILSRCQRFDFRRLESKTLVAALKRIASAEQLDVEESALFAVARASDGSLRDAEVVLEQLASFTEGPIREQDVTQLLGCLEQDTLVAWTQALLDRDARTALLLLTKQLEQGKEVAQLITGLLMHLRNLLILRTMADTHEREKLLERLLDVPPDQIGRLDEQARRWNLEELLLVVQLLTGAYELARRSPFAQAILEFVIIKLTMRESWTSLDQAIQRLERLSRELPASVTSASPPEVSSGLPATSEPQPAAQPHALPPSAAPPSSPRDVTGSVSRPEPNARSQQALSDEGSLISLEEIKGKWGEVLRRVGKQRMSLAAYLTDAKPIAVSDQCVRLGLPGFALHQEVLTVTENLRLVERMLQEITGQPLSVSYTTLPASSPDVSEPPAEEFLEPLDISPPRVDAEQPSKPVPPIVQEILQLFDATIIEQPPSPKP